MHPLSIAALLLGPQIQTSPRLVEDVRAALSVKAAPWSATQLSGMASFYSLPGKYTLTFGPGGRYVKSVENELGQSFGFDGTEHWQTDRSGAPRSLFFEDVDVEQGVTVLLTDRWLDQDSPIKRTVGGNTITLLHPSGMKQAVVIDPKTSLPVSSTFSSSAGTISVTVSDWRPAGSMKVPFKAEVTTGGLTDTFTVNDAKEFSPAPKAYSKPAWTARNVTFDTTKTAEIETKKAISGHLLVHPLVNGKDVGWFILDSGADIMVIDSSTADDLKLDKKGALPLVGIGGVVTESFRPVDQFQLGPMTIQNTYFTQLDLKEIGKILNIQLAGIVGYDLFRRAIVEVDLDKPAVRLFDPESYTLQGAEWTPTRFSGGNPTVEATLEGDRKGWFRLDTGANGTVSFHAPFVEKEKLLEGRRTTPSGSMGVGGISASQSGTIEWFELAGHRFEKPSATFSQAKVGAFSDPYLAGNIGHDFMRPFTLVFDFGGSRVGFVPKKQP